MIFDIRAPSDNWQFVDKLNELVCELSVPDSHISHLVRHILDRVRLQTLRAQRALAFDSVSN